MLRVSFRSDRSICLAFNSVSVCTYFLSLHLWRLYLLLHVPSAEQHNSIDRSQYSSTSISVVEWAVENIETEERFSCFKCLQQKCRDISFYTFWNDNSTEITSQWFPNQLPWIIHWNDICFGCCSCCWEVNWEIHNKWNIRRALMWMR